MEEKSTNKLNRDYVTNLLKRRSIIALCSGIITLVFAFYGIIAGIIRTVEVMGINGFYSFIFYTMISNTLAAFSVTLIIPFAVEGIKRKSFILPKWIAVLHYISATSIAIMMFLVLAIMSWIAPDNAFEGSNFITHVICPILILISFFQIENGYVYSLKNLFFACIPFYIYVCIYSIEVFLIGEANGGWIDIYKIKEYMSPIIAIPILLFLGFCVSWLVAIISNFLTKKRVKKRYLYLEKNLEPVEAKIEAYGLGNMMSQIKDENSILIPLDILNYIAKKSQVNTEDLIKSYITGLINGQKASKINNK